MVIRKKIIKKITSDKNSSEKKVVLSVHNLYKSYGKKEVLKGLSFDVYEGEIFGLIGKNGIGKSTTIDCIVGSKNYDRGDITIDSISLTHDPIKVKKSYGYVASEPALYEMMTGYEYLSFIASIYNVIPKIYKTNLKILMEKFDLPSRDLHARISSYSHGMKQKLCLMASMIHNPRVWILDEPTVGLDVMVYQSLVGVMKEFAAHGRTVFITSHNLDMVSKICNRVAIINDGKIEKLIDLDKEPIYRATLSKVFFEIYKRDENVA